MIYKSLRIVFYTLFDTMLRFTEKPVVKPAKETVCSVHKFKVADLVISSKHEHAR